MNSASFSYGLRTAILSLLISLTSSYGQSKSLGDDQCVVSFSVASVREFKRSLENDESLPIRQLGKIDITNVTEGTEISRKYQIPNSQLRVLVDILFDDDLSRDLGNGKSVPTDAMTLWLTIWNGPERNPQSVLAVAINQVALTPYFFRSVTSAYAKKGSKIYFVLADCTAKSEEEPDKP